MVCSLEPRPRSAMALWWTGPEFACMRTNSVTQLLKEDVKQIKKQYVGRLSGTYFN
jgi:hypothetical protein